jgi:hypothetical protein
MADQYDDGRYDSGYTELAGGWRIPDSQMTGWPFGPRGILQPERRAGPTHAMSSIGYLPITAVRGGIKYPTKGTTVPSLNSQLAALKNKQTNLAAEIANLEAKVKAQRPKAPPSHQNRWAIDVRFREGGMLYTFLILRAGGKFYTTGTGDDKVFFGWDELLHWLDGMVQHSAMIPLVCDYEVPAALEGRQ